MTTVAGIYARKSTDDSDRNEEARSTQQQVESATAFAKSKGWLVDPRHIYIDDAVSGAEWKNRHAFNRLISALDGPAPPFQILVAMELSRIGRDSVRTPAAVQTIEEAGVALWGYLAGQQISLADESSEIQTMFGSMAASFERRRASQRTRDALKRRAEAGYCTGNRLYGYRNVRGEGDRAFVKRAINPEEAQVVVRIFTLYGHGQGAKSIAKLLNRERVPAPRAQGWSQGGVLHVLQNERYLGKQEWGRTKTVMRRGTRMIVPSAGQEVTRDLPELRIIPEALWQAVVDQRKARGMSFPRRA